MADLVQLVDMEPDGLELLAMGLEELLLLVVVHHGPVIQSCSEYPLHSVLHALLNLQLLLVNLHAQRLLHLLNLPLYLNKPRQIRLLLLDMEHLHLFYLLLEVVDSLGKEVVCL